MQTVVIVIHLLIVIALVGVVLIQRSEGGGLGIGGGSGFMTARGTKNALTRLTAILAGCFFLTSIILTVLQAMPGSGGADILDRIPAGNTQNQGSVPQGNILDQLGSPQTESEGNSAVPGTDGADTATGQPQQAPSQSDVPN